MRLQRGRRTRTRHPLLILPPPHCLQAGDAFESYAAEIRVQYRAGEGLRALDRNHHSGGERSVATMLYLIALQVRSGLGWVGFVLDILHSVCVLSRSGVWWGGCF